MLFLVGNTLNSSGNWDSAGWFWLKQYKPCLEIMLLAAFPSLQACLVMEGRVGFQHHKKKNPKEGNHAVNSKKELVFIVFK